MPSQKTKVKVLIIAFNLAIRQAEGSYYHHHNCIHTIACDTLRGCIKHIDPCDRQFEIMELLSSGCAIFLNSSMAYLKRDNLWLPVPPCIVKNSFSRQSILKLDAHHRTSLNFCSGNLQPLVKPTSTLSRLRVSSGSLTRK
jgi:hypothetical protein